MELVEIVRLIADILKDFDSEHPVHNGYSPGIGPFTEPLLVSQIALRLTSQGIPARTTETPADIDMDVQGTWALEFKTVRPYRNDDKPAPAEHWSQNLLHPYEGSTSLMGDAIKLLKLDGYPQKGLVAVGYEHRPARTSLDPLISSFELVSKVILGIPLGPRIEERREGLVHPTHQVLRCFAWQLEVQSLVASTP